MPELDVPQGHSLGSAVDRQIIDKLQGGFPLCERPYAAAAEQLNPVESFIVEVSPAIGVHTGPGTAGLCFFPVRS